jgi:hypothetical protein
MIYKIVLHAYQKTTRGFHTKFDFFLFKRSLFKYFPCWSCSYYLIIVSSSHRWTHISNKILL